ncbi:MAG: hypothetical protein QNJ62_12920 [Methyloceanibacter sp.]|nr:hypothetical protein [Methyloceanibacter sp.]
MGLRLTPPTKNVFYVSIICIVFAVALYLFGVLGLVTGGFASVAHFAFWSAVLGWFMLTLGVALKGV